MKTTLDLPDDLLIAAKKRAAERGITLRQLFIRGLRRELADESISDDRADDDIRWIVVEGGLPPGVEPADRAQLHDWIRTERSR